MRVDGQTGCGAHAAREWLGQCEEGWGDLGSDGSDACEGRFRHENEVRKPAVNSRSKQAHVRAYVGAATGAWVTVPAGDLRREADLRSRRGGVDVCGKVVSQSPDAGCDFVAEDDSGAHAVRLLSRRDTQVRAAQGRRLDGEENVARAELRDWAFFEREGTGGVKRRREHGGHESRIRRACGLRGASCRRMRPRGLVEAARQQSNTCSI